MARTGHLTFIITSEVFFPITTPFIIGLSFGAHKDEVNLVFPVPSLLPH